MKFISSAIDSDVENHYSINQVGMKLSLEQNCLIKKKLESLELRAPALSFVNLSFIDMGRCVEGNLTIYGFGVKFSSTVSGKNPLAIFEILEVNIDRQLKTWKKTRFLDYKISGSVPNQQ